MISKKQRIANQQNALKSTGPRTDEGKAVVAKNAIKHGFFAKEVILSEDETEEFEEFFQGMLEFLSPQDALESILAERVIGAAWRLRRLVQIETLFYKESCRWGKLHEGFNDSADGMGTLSRYEYSLEKSFFYNLKELNRLKSVKRDSEINGFVLETTHNAL